MDYSSLIKTNQSRWLYAEFKSPDFKTAKAVAKKLVAAKDRYVAVSKKTSVPWFIIAVIHQRESSQDWSRSLAQGDPWNRVSKSKPAGRGPFSSWEEAAIDALTNCSPYASKWKDWTAGGSLTLLELYNGLGYYNRNLPSPYIWSGSDVYESGKFTRDHYFDPDVVDKQLGCAILIQAMRDLDSSVQFVESDLNRDKQVDDEDNTVDTWWGRFKNNFDFIRSWNWAAIKRQFGIIAATATGFISEYKVETAIVVGLIALFAIWVAMGRPKFWKRS